MPKRVQAPVACASIDRLALGVDAVRGADMADWQVQGLCFAEEAG